MSVAIGVDPGTSGGIAVIYSPVSGSPVVTLQAIDKLTEHELWDFVQSCQAEICYAVMEKVGGFIQGSPAPGSAMFNFGCNFGMLRMALVAAGIPFELETPQRWMKFYGIVRAKTESKTEWKRRLKELAQRLYPNEKITNATADALLMAHYAKKTKL